MPAEFIRERGEGEKQQDCRSRHGQAETHTPSSRPHQAHSPFPSELGAGRTLGHPFLILLLNFAGDEKKKKDVPVIQEESETDHLGRKRLVYLVKDPAPNTESEVNSSIPTGEWGLHAICYCFNHESTENHHTSEESTPYEKEVPRQEHTQTNDSRGVKRKKTKFWRH